VDAYILGQIEGLSSFMHHPSEKALNLEVAVGTSYADANDYCKHCLPNIHHLLREKTPGMGSNPLTATFLHAAAITISLLTNTG
jgi:hypothetical protein